MELCQPMVLKPYQPTSASPSCPSMHCLDMHRSYLQDMWETNIGQSSHLTFSFPKNKIKRCEKHFIIQTINHYFLPLKTKRGVIILPDAVTVKAHVAHVISDVDFLI